MEILMNARGSRLFWFLLPLSLVALVGLACQAEDDDNDADGGETVCADCPATLTIRNNQSGCTLVELYITKSGESKGENLIEDEGIGYHKTQDFELEPGKYSVEVHSNCGVTFARGSVTLQPEQALTGHVTSNCGEYACRGEIDFF